MASLLRGINSKKNARDVKKHLEEDALNVSLFDEAKLTATQQKFKELIEKLTNENSSLTKSIDDSVNVLNQEIQNLMNLKNQIENYKLYLIQCGTKLNSKNIQVQFACIKRYNEIVEFIQSIQNKIKATELQNNLKNITVPQIDVKPLELPQLTLKIDVEQNTQQGGSSLALKNKEAYLNLNRL